LQHGQKEKTTGFSLPYGTPGGSLVVLFEYRGRHHASKAAMDSDAKL